MHPPRPGHVDVWTVQLDRPDHEVAKLGGLLTETELLRAGNIKTERGRSRAVVTRAAVRSLLAHYLETPPDELSFATGRHGKPKLARPRTANLTFNLSHSAGAALIAISTEDEVGADIEELRPRFDLPGVARQLFTESEREAAADSTHAFYRHWTAKEAYVKAIGHGIASLKSFEVMLDAPGGGARIVHVGGDRNAARRFTLAPLDEPTPGYTGAVVVERENAQVQTPREFTPSP